VLTEGHIGARVCVQLQVWAILKTGPSQFLKLYERAGALPFGKRR
jgi:hypothetical protein